MATPPGFNATEERSHWREDGPGCHRDVQPRAWLVARSEKLCSVAYVTLFKRVMGVYMDENVYSGNESWLVCVFI